MAAARMLIAAYDAPHLTELLGALAGAVEAARPLYADVAARHALSAEQWQRVPADNAALLAALARRRCWWRACPQPTGLGCQTQCARLRRRWRTCSGWRSATRQHCR